jgi:DNA-binding NtrC family response regulator
MTPLPLSDSPRRRQVKVTDATIRRQALRTASRRDVEVAIGCECNVWITCESPDTAERLARLLHEGSRRRGAPFLPVTGRNWPNAAIDAPPGIVERAAGGTLFVESADELDALGQASLSELLTHPGAPRVIATASRSVADRLRSGLFAHELFYRLNTIHLIVVSEADLPLDRVRPRAMKARLPAAQAEE